MRGGGLDRGTNIFRQIVGDGITDNGIEQFTIFKFCDIRHELESCASESTATATVNFPNINFHSCTKHTQTDTRRIGAEIIHANAARMQGVSEIEATSPTRFCS